MNILCFGDSNTYGYRPDGTGRFDEKTRWTCLLQKNFGRRESDRKTADGGWRQCDQPGEQSGYRDDTGSGSSTQKRSAEDEYGRNEI